MRFYVTYGFDTPDKNCYSIVEAEDYGAARVAVHAARGTNWAFLYDDEGWVVEGKTQAELYGLRCIPLDLAPAQPQLTLTLETNAFFPEWVELSRLSQPDPIDAMTFSRIEMTSAGWNKLGRATITVHLDPEDALVRAAVEAVQTEIASERASAERKCAMLQRKLDRLLALENRA